MNAGCISDANIVFRVHSLPDKFTLNHESPDSNIPKMPEYQQLAKCQAPY